MSLRIVVFASGAFAVPPLRALAADFPLQAVYTQPPRPKGRGHRTQPTPVQEAAEALGIPALRTPSRLGAEVVEELRALGPDVAVVAAYGLILPPELLAVPRLGCVNIHASLLPRWRGAAPVARAIEAGDRESGVSFFVMDAGVDTGPLLERIALPIGPEERAWQLEMRLAEQAAREVGRVLRDYAAGRLVPVPQPAEGACYAAKLRKEEGRLDFHADASLLARRVRAFDPWPGCWFVHRGVRLRVLDAVAVEGAGPAGTVIREPLVVACGRGALEIRSLQREGRRPLDSAALLRGFPIPPGTRLG